MKLHHALVLGLALLGVSAPVVQAAPQTTNVEKVASTSSADAKIHLNSADAEQLQTLSGVGPVTAQAILDWREENGPFKAVDQLLAVKGIGPKTLENLRSQLAL